MADKKISALPAASTPLAGSEVLPIVQSGTTVKVSVANLTAGRTTAMSLLDVENSAGGGVLGTFKSNWSNTRVAVEGDGATGAGVLNISNVAASAPLPFKIKMNGTEVVDLSTGGNLKATTGNIVVGTAGKGITTSVTNGDVNLIPNGSGIVASDSGHSFNKIASRRVSKAVAKSGTAVLTVTPVSTTSTHLAVRIDINVAFTNSTNLQYHAGYLVLTCDQTTNGGGTAIAEYYNGTVGNFVVATTDFVVTRPGSGQLVVTYTNNNGADSNNIEFAVTGVFEAATIA